MADRRQRAVLHRTGSEADGRGGPGIWFRVRVRISHGSLSNANRDRGKRKPQSTIYRVAGRPVPDQHAGRRISHTHHDDPELASRAFSPRKSMKVGQQSTELVAARNVFRPWKAQALTPLRSQESRPGFGRGGAGRSTSNSQFPYSTKITGPNLLAPPTNVSALITKKFGRLFST